MLGERAAIDVDELGARNFGVIISTPYCSASRRTAHLIDQRRQGATERHHIVQTVRFIMAALVNGKTSAAELA